MTHKKGKRSVGIGSDVHRHDVRVPSVPKASKEFMDIKIGQPLTDRYRVTGESQVKSGPSSEAYESSMPTYQHSISLLQDSNEMIARRHPELISPLSSGSNQQHNDIRSPLGVRDQRRRIRMK